MIEDQLEGSCCSVHIVPHCLRTHPNTDVDCVSTGKLVNPPVLGGLHVVQTQSDQVRKPDRAPLPLKTRLAWTM